MNHEWIEEMPSKDVLRRMLDAALAAKYNGDQKLHDNLMVQITEVAKKDVLEAIRITREKLRKRKL